MSHINFVELKNWSEEFNTLKEGKKFCFGDQHFLALINALKSGNILRILANCPGAQMTTITDLIVE